MKVAIFGLGYVGFTAACCISSEGHEVIGVDVSAAKINDINNGRAPFEEPGLSDLMKKGCAVGGLSATKDAEVALQDTDLAIVCVGTPSGADGSHDMSYIIQVSREISLAVKKLGLEKLSIAYRSTMRPGSIRNLIAPIFANVLTLI